MKIKISLCFLLLCAVPLLFCTGCSKGDSKYDVDDEQTETDRDSDTPQEESDADTVTDEDQNNNDDETDTADDESDTVSDDTGDTAERPDDADTGEVPNDNDDTDSDNDDEPGKNDNEPAEAGDNDSISHKDDDPEILCTGQNQCFDNSTKIECPATPEDKFFGQDAQYANKQGYCLKKSFSVPSDNDQIVTDNITGLIWQRILPSKYDGCENEYNPNGNICLYSAAANYCSNLVYGGFNDWRLPTPDEFATIIDFGKSAPALDTNFFPSPQTADKDFWASDKWYADFTEGSISSGEDEGKYVRCVRGTNQLAKPDFTVLNEGNEEEIVEDSAHNLLWTKTPAATALKWKQALDYCIKLNYNGTDGWRLPNVNELASILDYSITTSPVSEFPSLPSTVFWTSTSSQDNAGNAWRVWSENGKIESGYKANTANVICVK